MCEFTVVGSKFVGTGLAKEHMTHTQVAFAGVGVLGPEDERLGCAPKLCRGEAAELRDGDSAVCLGLAMDDRFGLWINGLFAAFGYRVILAEERRNPALDQMSELSEAGT